MNLYFLRRGPAGGLDGVDEGLSADRPLTDAGAVRVKAEARALSELDLKVDLVLTSPMARARQTAEIIARRLGVELIVEPELGPGFDAATAARITACYPAANGIMLVGHEPDFSTTISALIGGARVDLKCGGLARVKVEWREAGALAGTLVWLLPPRVLARA